jgi:preprotein translocase subunit YajC
MKKSIGYAIIFVFIMGIFAFTMPQQKTYKLELTTQEVQVIYDALGELPAKVSEGIRAKVAKQVGEQNANGTK